MSLKMDVNEDKLTVFLVGEIDHHSATKIREEVDLKITQLRPKSLELNFTNVSFMDSSGIGLIIGRYKLASSLGCTTFISGASAYLKRVMRLAGIDLILEIKSSQEETK